MYNALKHEKHFRKNRSDHLYATHNLNSFPTENICLLVSLFYKTDERVRYSINEYYKTESEKSILQEEITLS